MTTCPKCAAILRIPENAEMVRCPRCKTVMNLVEEKNDIPVAQPLPVAQALPSRPVRPAIPLPFGRSTTAAEPLDPIPADIPLREETKQAKLIKDEDPAEIREREIREQAKKEAREAEEREERKFERLRLQCKPAQQGITILAWGSALYSGAMLLCFLFATCYVIGFSIMLSPLLYLAALLGAVNWALSVIGLAFCVGGPKSVRPMAASALIFAAAHSILFVIQLAGSLAKFATVARDMDLNSFQALLTFQVLGSVSNLNVLTEFAGSLIVSQTPDWLGTAGGVLELTRLIMIGMLCQYYATEGKDSELGFMSLKFITRVFLVVLAVTAIKIVVKWIFAGSASLDASWTKFGAAVASMSSAGLFLTLAIVLYAQAQVMFDTAAIIDARRFIMKKLASMHF